MPLRLKVKKRDLIRIGDVLVGVDVESAEITLIIDAPRELKIVRTENPGKMAITKLMALEKSGTRPQADEPSGGAPPKT